MKKFSIMILSAVIPLAAHSQNLNPEVVVENAYVPSVTEMDRQVVTMSVPDSLHDFDYHFDYSVFDSPYRGAYEFSPYSVNVKPEQSVSDARKFYLKFGAGYIPRPELKLFWTPVSRKKFALTVSDDASGFFGPYSIFSEGKGFQLSDSYGYDFTNHTDVVARTWMGKSMLKADVGYDGFYSSELYGAGGVSHSAYGKLRLMSESERADRFHYDLGASYRFLTDKGMNYHDVFLDGVLGGTFGNRRLSFLLDFNLDGNSFYNAMDVAPHVDLILGVFNLSLGARLGLDMQKGANRPGILLYPDIEASVNIVSDHLQLYVFADGGPQYNSYFSLKSSNHRYGTTYSAPEITFERLKSGIGVRGQISSRFQYDAKAGYDIIENTPLYTVNSGNGVMKENFIYSNYKAFHADASLQWHGERLDSDLSFRYLKTDLSEDSNCFAPAAYSGSLDVRYNWSRRIFAGVSATAASTRYARTCAPVDEIPWYLDLGVELQYRINRVWTVWARGGNLLNMDCMQSPLYRCRGISGTAGIIVNL